MQTFDAQDALAWACAALAAPHPSEDYKDYTRYLNGDTRLEFATEKYRRAFGGIFKRFGYNRCAAVVSAHSERLFIERFEAGADEQRDQAIQAIWDANRMDRRQVEVHEEALGYGDGYLIVWPDPDGFPRLWPQQAALCRVRYDDEFPGLTTLGLRAWMEQGYIRLNVYHPDRIERYISNKRADGGENLKPDGYREYDGDGGPIIDNPYLTVPVFHFANDARTGSMGRSELLDVAPIQDALNKTLIDMMVAEEFGAYPQKVILGIELDASPVAPGEQPTLAQRQARALANFSLGVDRYMGIADPDGKTKIAEFAATTLKQFTDVANFWDDAIAHVSKVPVHYLRLTGSFPSGRALRTAEAPFTAKIVDKQRAFGNVWEDAVALALRIAGDSVATNEPVSAVWQSAAPRSEEDMYDLALQKDALGIPLELILEQAGWTEDELAELDAARQAATQRKLAEQQQMLAAAGGLAPTPLAGADLSGFGKMTLRRAASDVIG